MKGYSTIKIERAREGVATVTFNRPSKGNALNGEMLREIENVFTEISQDNSIRAVIITGAGPCFCTGADIGWFRDLTERRARGEYGEEVSYSHRCSTLIGLALRSTPQPTIASINGLAIGGGATLALACDIRIAAEEAKMSFPFASTVGISPELGSTYTLPRLVGIDKACELIFTGKSVTGKEAKEIGLVSAVVPLTDLSKVTSELADKIAGVAPTAVQLAKKALYHGLNSDIHNQLLWEEEALRLGYDSEEHKEAITAFFEKRKPVFKNRK